MKVSQFVALSKGVHILLIGDNERFITDLYIDREGSITIDDMGYSNKYMDYTITEISTSPVQAQVIYLTIKEGRSEKVL